MFTSQAQVESVLEWLDSRGIREYHLKQRLEMVYDDWLEHLHTPEKRPILASPAGTIVPIFGPVCPNVPTFHIESRQDAAAALDQALSHLMTTTAVDMTHGEPEQNSSYGRILPTSRYIYIYKYVYR